MSIASDYAAAIASDMNTLSGTEATRPPEWVGPLGKMKCVVMNDGTAELTANNVSNSVPPAVLLAFADWVIATFR